MFCCRKLTDFTPSHELDGITIGRARGSLRKRVITLQPGTPTIEDEKEPEDETGVNKSGVSSLVQGTPRPKKKNDYRSNDRPRAGLFAKKVDTSIEIPSHPKPNGVADALKCAILNNQFLHDIIPDEVVDQVVDAMAPREVSKDEVIIEQGETGNQFFVNETGSYKIIVNGEVFSEFSTPTVFGELAILYHQKRGATVMAIKKGKIWSIEGNVYKVLMNKAMNFEKEQRRKFLSEVKTIQNCSAEKLNQMANLLNIQFYPSNTVIVRQGDVGNKFYIIKAGKVTVTKDGEVVATLAESQYFGEKALITDDDKRQATCTAEPPGVTCYELSRQEFRNYLGDFDDFMKPEVRTSKQVSLEVEPVKTENLPLLSQLDKLCTIGEGGFGRVLLVRDLDNKRFYALKQLSRNDNKLPEQRTHILTEKRIHLLCRSDFIVRLHTTYNDRRYLYFLMDVCMGGDLFSHMQQQKGRCFPQETARFIAGCILEALDYLHSRSFVYRDLKPENMLIDSDGYVKLADFGFAKVITPGTSALTFVGTPEYVAPEVIGNKGHNREVDYWAFGIFIFELLSGKTPFKSNDPSYMVTYTMILKGIDNIIFPKQIGKEATNLVKRLCRLKPHERLGAITGGIKNIRDHKWFKPLSWQELQARQIESSFKPKLTSDSDISYFEEHDEDYPEPPIDRDTFWDNF